jgi:UDP-N-acetylglucosamine 3-dehydrogenase
MIRVGLLGAGKMGRAHASAYAAIPDAEVVAVLARDHHRATLLAATFGARAYDDAAEMLETEQLDAVDCCLPTPVHRQIVELAANHRCHVICEKPMALTLEDGRAMISAAREAGIRLLIAQVVRFFPEYRRLATALHDGEIGAPASLTMLRQSPYPVGSADWYRDDGMSGGVFVDLMVHDFDWALHNMGPAQRVYARMVLRGAPHPFAQGVATIRHQSGVLSQFTGTWGHPGPFMTMVELAGDGGLLRHHSAESIAFRAVLGSSAGGVADVPGPDLVGGENPYHTQLAHFIDVLHGRAEPLVAPEESLAALSLALEARESATTGLPRILEGGAK